MSSNHKFEEILALDLQHIKIKLMHAESGEGWSQRKADAVEMQYKRFLCLMKEYPDQQMAPLVDVDTFWHYHILDTMKYAADCETVFGYFLHHYPYLGMGDESDEAARELGAGLMAELYEQTFGDSYIEAARSMSQAAAEFCTVPESHASAANDAAFCAAPAKPAFCAAPSKPVRDAVSATAFCAAPSTPAFCAAPSKPASGTVQATAAFCAAPAKPAFCAAPSKSNAGAMSASAAFCAAPAKPAFCAAPSKAVTDAMSAAAAFCAAPAKPAFCAAPANWASGAVKATVAFCAAPAKPAFCAAPAKPVARAGSASAAFCAAPARKIKDAARAANSDPAVLCA
jgi:hypothetical protein